MLSSNIPHQYISEELTGDSSIMQQLRTENKLNSILDYAEQLLIEGKGMVIQISKDLDKISKIYSKFQIERYTRVVERLSPEYLEKERTNNRAKYLLVQDDAKILLHALNIGDRAGYALRYSQYIDALRQLYEISLMMQAIDEHNGTSSLD